MKTPPLKILKIAALGVLALSLTGCQTLMQQQRSQRVRQYSELEVLRRDVAQLKDQVRELAASRERVYQETEAARTATEATARQLKARMNAIEQAQKTSVARQDQQKQDIISSLSAKMSGLLKKRAAQTPSTPTHVRGREHTVEEGQTLSEIARAYGTKTSVIQKANKITNPNSVRVGQVLFIPE
jgi:LysM repeat protein